MLWLKVRLWLVFLGSGVDDPDAACRSASLRVLPPSASDLSFRASPGGGKPRSVDNSRGWKTYFSGITARKSAADGRCPILETAFWIDFLRGRNFLFNLSLKLTKTERIGNIVVECTDEMLSGNTLK
ncbi:hypothetical protein K402DRAFT_116439 [Aulographum hederae CBS 113979]|uniref:Secreted protein n=1 Tax=Aulographum hederae CBS 113979 TaxID=1176131 RepID=A0A6G1GW26_9PEZI|nr:hypothetical protein K402DRAFT_116439 [Aulographum hederae CBS 113979]